jgi:hypothetical protein
MKTNVTVGDGEAVAVNPVIGTKGLMIGCAVIAIAVLVALALRSASAWLVGPFKLIQSTSIQATNKPEAPNACK